jgi:hypothetical protein
MSTFLLVHSPLLGPAVWQPCAEVLRQRGNQAFVPDLRSAVDVADGWWQRYADACGPLLDDHDGTVVVAHSGAGVAVPAIVARGAASAAVFVDALVPARQGATESGAQIREFVANLVRANGRLPVWTSWWPADELDNLVADSAERRALIAEQPELPGDFYDFAVPVPSGWDSDVAVRYVQLSSAYDSAAQEAVARGWPVNTVAGTHLDLLTRPGRIADALLNSAQ